MGGALRQALDEDLRRFIREGIISVTDQDDTPAVFSELQKYIRRQCNPLLDRLAFYGRKQQQGESFDSFFSSLHELYKASDFESPICQSCKERVCNDCSRTTLSSNLDMLRDRVVCGILDDAVPQKLLAEPALTLKKQQKFVVPMKPPSKPVTVCPQLVLSTPRDTSLRTSVGKPPSQSIAKRLQHQLPTSQKRRAPLVAAGTTISPVLL